MKLQISKGQAITPELIMKILELHLTDEARKTKLSNYYVGKQEILLRQMADTSKPNNKIVHSFGNYITDSIVGYFMGQPVTYSTKDEQSKDFLEQLKSILNYNDEQSENVELSKDSSKYGVAYELLYLDEDANIRFALLDPIHAIPIYSNTLDNELIYFIRYYNDNIMNPESKVIEVISDTEIRQYRLNNKEISFLNATSHLFGMVPVAIYSNNAEELGDYELVISLIDAYDKLNSDSVNDFEQFADAYLTLKGMNGTSTDDIATMKENRVLLLPDDGSADWLVKTINDTYFQNTIKTLDADIHKFSKVPNMSDEAFGGNLSGIAIKYKLIGLENKVAIKESLFKKGLQKRIELISAILDVMGNAFNYLDISVQFHRNLPVNELEAVQMANQLVGLISDESIIETLPFIEDAKLKRTSLRKNKPNPS